VHELDEPVGSVERELHGQRLHEHMFVSQVQERAAAAALSQTRLEAVVSS